MLHALPFQCIINVCMREYSGPAKPTAHISLAEATAISCTKFAVPALGLGTMLQLSEQAGVGIGVGQVGQGVGVFVGVRVGLGVLVWVAVALGEGGIGVGLCGQGVEVGGGYEAE